MNGETLKPQGVSLEPSQMQQLQDGLAVVLAAVNQLTQQQNDMQTKVELLGSKVGRLKHEMVEIESRIEDLSTKLEQQAAKTSSLEAKMRYTDLSGKRRERASTSKIKGGDRKGIKNKSAEIQLHIESLDQKPDVIALQETGGRPRIPGYVTYADPSEEGTAVLVRSNVAATQHLTAQKGCEHTLVEIHTRTTGSGGNLFVMSAYCRPSRRDLNFDETVGQAKQLAGNRPLLVLGDFNAPHTTWGYKFQSKRRKALVKTMEDLELALLNEPGVATRRRTGTNRDTVPDLSWLAGTLDANWRNEDVSLGSDHDILSVTIRGPKFRAKIGTARITDWDRMRKEEEDRERQRKKDREESKRHRRQDEFERQLRKKEQESQLQIQEMEKEHELALQRREQRLPQRSARSGGGSDEMFKCGKMGHHGWRCLLEAPQKPSAPLKESASACMVEGLDELKNGGETTIVGAGFFGESPADTQGRPVVEGFVGERKVRVLRETGCNTVIGKRCLVSDKYLTGAKSPVRLLDCSVLMLPEASITVATPYFSSRLKAKCLENLMYDLVLWNVERARPINCADLHWGKEAKLQKSAHGDEL
ncbi:hypothetical protein HPB48_000889 [Haemaphysalis longicornis]|uniref:Endonuclease/exonuclease/phosphatase domain-containing protein n=1 Tax=Haemaphysalis longicornis TaxID=44386 RepID=A0A9J6H636_HAELO|nr:hypothetical protein HPB48_000889 [Haemaphysalis longicornis]